MLEHLVQCVQLGQKELVGSKELTLMMHNISVSVQDVRKYYGAFNVGPTNVDVIKVGSGRGHNIAKTEDA